jgi:Phosphotransferase enzyme family
MMHVPILKHDPAAGLSEALLERLRTAMSRPAMLEILRRDWPYLRQSNAELVDCQLVRVSPRLPHGFVLHYEVTLRRGGEQRLQPVLGELTAGAARRHYQQAIGKLRKGKRRQLTESSPLAALAVLPDPGMVLRLAGYDERLYGLKLVHKPRLLRPTLLEHVDRSSEIERIRPEMLGHRLGKRCIVRFRFQALEEGADGASRGSVIAKLYKDRTTKGRQVFADMQRLCADGFGNGSDLTIPRPIAFLPEENVVLMEDVPGKLLAERPSGRQREGAVAAGQILGKLHTSAFHPPRRHRADDEIALLEPWVALVSRIHPDLEGLATTALLAVRPALAACADARLTPSHRDFYDKQVLLAEGGATLIDFDTFCMADPALDVGNFLAHLELARLQGVMPGDGLADGFLEGYRRTAGRLPGATRLAAFEAGSLLRLACLYALSTRWRTLAVPLLGACSATLRARS